MTPLILLFLLLICSFHHEGKLLNSYGVAHLPTAMLAGATDITFQRGDDDLLPLSAKYRSNLRKLCGLLKGAEGNSKALPAEWQDKRAELAAMCAKLAKDDRMEEHDDGGQVSSWTAKNGLFVGSCIVGLLGGYMIFAKQLDVAVLWGSALRFVRGLFSRKSAGHAVGGVAFEDEQRIAREARLRRFAELNN